MQTAVGCVCTRRERTSSLLYQGVETTPSGVSSPRKRFIVWDAAVGLLQVFDNRGMIDGKMLSRAVPTIVAPCEKDIFHDNTL